MGRTHPIPRPASWDQEATWSPRVTSGRTSRRRSGGGSGGSLRFLAFLLVTAAIVLVGLVTVARPALTGLVLAVAGDNPGAWSIGFVADVVREDLGDRLTEPASDDPSVLTFTIASGETASQIASRLESAGLVSDSRAFLFLAVERGLTGSFEAGDFLLRRNMTPDQLVATLLEAKDPSVVLQLRQGLRLEQVTALLQSRPPEIAALQLDAADFYDLVTAPPASLLADYPWLDLPAGASLEGYLAGGAYRLLPDATAEELVRQMLDRWYADVGPERLAVAADRGLSFREVLVLASIVQREAALEAEMARIAGVYQNRLDREMRLQADPTVIYGVDTVELGQQPIGAWPQYSFWNVPSTPMAEVELPAELAGYQTYQRAGLPPGPLATPTVAAIDAALAPDQAKGFLYFVAIPGGEGAHDFSRTYDEHLAKLRKYGYIK
ncbi:MAG: endolytic transglycosylase MltG [Chloroflexi bacterium]|nr:endolytic transglycosylase MltG [Chloroflexota bacterium]